MPEPAYASFRRRLLASLVDNASWVIFYFAFCEWRWGQTMGKNATGIEVRSCERARQRDPSNAGAKRLTYGQASIRNLLRLVDLFVVGELMIATTERKQRLGDKAARTIVVRRAPRAARETASSQEPAS